MKTTMSKSAARRMVRAWAQALRPDRWTVDNMLCYGQCDIARAIRVLGSEDAWSICFTA